MGWFERDWYLGAAPGRAVRHAGATCGTTVWCDGRIVGGWRQHADGAVEIQFIDPVPAARRRAIDAEAARLTDWFDGVRVLQRFPSPLSKAQA